MIIKRSLASGAFIKRDVQRLRISTYIDNEECA